MDKVMLRKEPDGWRICIIRGNKVSVLDEFYEDEIDAAEAAMSYSD